MRSGSTIIKLPKPRTKKKQNENLKQDLNVRASSTIGTLLTSPKPLTQKFK